MSSVGRMARGVRSGFGWRLVPWLGALAVAVFVVQFVGRKAVADPGQFLITGLNGLTLGGLYFLVASGFTLIFGVMRVVNLAHGGFYLLGGYLGWSIFRETGSWALAAVGAAVAICAIGVTVQQLVLRRIQGQDMREALVTIGVSIIIADLIIAFWGGAFVDIGRPVALDGTVRMLGEAYPAYRLFVLLVAIAVGLGLWLLLHRTRAGMIVRAAVDDRHMVSALGVNVELLYVGVFALGALLAGFSGVMGGSLLSLSPGEDGRYLLVSLVVVILGGMGSLGGAVLSAAAVGLVEQYAAVYDPTYSVLYTFVLMVIVLALRPRGLFGREA